MILRKAELKDYENYKKLIEEDDNHFYQWLYIDTITKPRLSKEEAKKEWNKMMGSDVDGILKEIFHCTIQKFQEELSKSYNHIYMIEDKNNILGYITFDYLYSGIYRIAEWAMFDSHDDDIKNQIWNQILTLKLPRLRCFTVYTTSKSTREWLLKNGFIDEKGCFYSFQVRKAK